MSKRNRQTKTNEQIENKTIALVLEELENDIQSFKIKTKKKKR